MKTADYCKMIMKQEGIKSAYGLGKIMGRTNQTALNWLKKGTSFDEDSAIRAADILGADRDEVLLDIAAESAHNPEAKKIFQRLANAARASVPVLLLCLCLFSPSQEARAGIQAESAPLNIRIDIMRIFVVSPV